MTIRTYTIILEPDPEIGRYAVLVPALPGCQTVGDTIEECVAMAREAIQLYLETLIESGQPIPEETMHPAAIPLDVAIPKIAEARR